MQHKIFSVREFIKTESATAVQCAFRLRFNIQPPTRNSICRWNHQFEQIGYVKAKAPADHLYQRRTWEEFKRVLRVAHASQPVERAENLEYRNQLSGVYWGAVFCSSHNDLRSAFIFWIILCIYIRHYPLSICQKTVLCCFYAGPLLPSHCLTKFTRIQQINFWNVSTA